MYQSRKPPQNPPCDTCKVELDDKNQDAAKIFTVVQGQFIMGQNGPVDINQEAIHSAMDLYGIQDKKACFEKVVKLGRYYIEEMSRDNG